MTQPQRTAVPTTQLTLTEYAVLGLLAQVGQPVSGYDLKKLADNSIGYIWQPSKTQLYLVLPRLVTAGCASERLVVQTERPNKRLYRVTRAGRRALRAWLDRDEAESEPDRSILVLKLFFGSFADRHALVRQLTAFRDAYQARLDTYEAKWTRTDRLERTVGDEFTRLTLHYGIVRARAALEWANAALDELS